MISIWQNHSVTFYPPKVRSRYSSPENAGVAAAANAEGTSASFTCGSFASVSLCIDDDSGSIEDARFRTNGCGYMIAAADALCDTLRGSRIVDLHGLRDMELTGAICDAIGAFPLGRGHCSEIVFEALRAAMAAYRRHRIEEFQGEKALICTCFGVSEETVRSTIADNHATEIDEVSALCRAGSGCGSCRMLIGELIDAHDTGPPFEGL